MYASVPRNDQELALVTRSMLEMLMDIASTIEVPADDVARGAVTPPRRFDNDDTEGYVPLIRIHSGTRAPEGAFVAIDYRGHAFWIDETDYQSKGIFSFVMMIFSLMDSAPPRGQPIVTVPAG